MKQWVLGLILTTFLNAGEKIALLIGNNDYSFQPLDNPLNDVDGIAKTLKEIGFKNKNITLLKNASKTEMESALANFSQKASSAEIALVYFSGHGMQVNNTNYMFPARTEAKKPVDLFGLVDLEYFIQSASSAKYGIILVDACRNNPLVKYFQNGKYKGSTAKKGLGQVTPIAGQVVIGFATSAGDTADDGSGSMSPYARALTKRLKEKDDIRNVFGKVAQDVSGRYEQNPIYRANLASSVYLSKYNNKVSEILKPKVQIIEKIDSKPSRVSKTTNKNMVIINGLKYQNQPFSSKVFTFQEAKKYCENLNLYGNGWRLPTKEELMRAGNIKLRTYKYDPNDSWFTKNENKRLINSKGNKHFIKKEFLENMPSSDYPYAYFWTTDTRKSKRWFVNFTHGESRWFGRGEKIYTMCVK